MSIIVSGLGQRWLYVPPKLDLSAPDKCLTSIINSSAKLNILDPIQQIGGTCPASSYVNFLRYVCPDLALRSHLQIMWDAVLLAKAAIKDVSTREEWTNKEQLNGSYTAYVLKAVELYGAADNNSWPSDNKRANRKPNALAVGSAYDCRRPLKNVVKLDKSQALLCLLNNTPILFTNFCYEEILKSDTYKLTGQGKSVGGHCWTGLGMTQDGLIIAQSTWENTGLDGKSIYHLTPDYFDEAFDFYTGEANK